ncbi:MAG: cytochrome c oxidase subunit II [Sphingomonadales bacterium]|nr:cytochrome c oxidase subunit II [Sphingomonadales bacterium]MDE2568556.1 cytochrome c oxidase subunit II [Sphingomonadales bacterium]
MSLSHTMRIFGKAARAAGLALALTVAPQALAQAAAPAAAPVEAPMAAAAPSAAASDSAAAKSGATYTPQKPTPGIGMPVDGGVTFQKQFSPTGQEALAMNDYVLLPIIVAITIFVLILLLVVIARFNRRANPVASKTAHNTMIEVVWTLVPVLILVVIAVPSIRLLANQYKAPPKNALTVKVTGYQWYWGYTYPDNGGFEVISYMLNTPGQPVVNPGVREDGSKPWDGPEHLEVDNRMVVPAGVPIRLQTTGADVIHSFAVPSLWFKLDAIPGRINEKLLFIDKPGVYYGQCSELCGDKHGYMPIAVEAVSMPVFNDWVKQQGGQVNASIEGEQGVAAPAPAAPAPAAGAPAPAASAAPSA